MKDSKPTVLFTSPLIKHPPKGGPYLRIENTIKALGKQSNLHLISRVSHSGIGGEVAVQFYKKICLTVDFIPFYKRKFKIIERWKSFFNRVLMKLIRRNYFSTGKPDDERNFKYILQKADEYSVDIIWLGYGNISYPLLRFLKNNSQYKIVCDTDSVWSRFVERRLPFAKNEEARQRIKLSVRKKEEEENWGTLLADVTLAVSKVDREYYKTLTDNKDKIKILSNVLDFDNYKNIPISRVKSGHSVYLAGTFGKKSPMEEAAHWIIDRVMPDLWVEFSDLHFYILGRNSDKVLNDVKDKRISILGEVESVLPYLCHVDIALVPLKFESGTRLKIMEAGICGIPIVSTTLGAEGIPVTHNENILIADTPDEFSDAIRVLLRDRGKAQYLATNCKKLIAENYGLENAISEITSVVSYLKPYRKN